MKKNRTKIKKSTKIMSGIMSFALLWNLIPTQIIMAVPEDEEPTEIASGEPVDEDIPDEQQIGNETDTEQNTDLTDDTENNTPGDDVEPGEDSDVTNDNDESSDNQENNDSSEEPDEPTDDQEDPTENPSEVTPVEHNNEETNDDQVQDTDSSDDKDVPEENTDAEPSDDKEGLEENKDDEKKEPEENKDSESSDDKKEEPLDEKSDAKKSGDDLNADNTKSGAKSNTEEPASDETDSEDSSNSGLRSEPTRGGDTPVQTEWVFNYTSEFLDYCSNTYTANPSGHQYDVLKMPFTYDDPEIRGFLSNEYIGLGTSDYPFAGTIYLADNDKGYYKFTNNGESFFNYVMDSVEILSYSSLSPVQIQFERTTANVDAGKSFPLLAQHVVSSGNPTNWDVQLTSGNIKEYSGVIGEIHTGATVNLKFTNNSGANVISNAGTGTSYVADVGAVCGKIDSGATLNLDFSESSSSYSITSANGNAGGLVGTMDGTAVLNIKNMPAASASKSVVSDLGYAGGLVGKSTSAATIALDSSSSLTEIAVAGSVTGSAGAGGLYGYYENTITNEFDISGYNCTAEVYGINCGGLFGLLKNDKGSGSAVTLTIKNTADAGVVSISSGSGSTYASTGYFGGIAGKYTTDSLTNSLVLDDFNVTVASNASFAAFGGVIGCVDSASYITADNLQITATGTAQKDSDDYFGGLIGKNSNTGGVFVDLGDFKVTSDSDEYKGGGIVGNFAKGVLRLKGTTDMSSAKSKKGGQLVGVNNNVLIYALGSGTNGTSSVRNGTTNEITTPASGWTFKRSNASQVDDLGTWGEVVRISNIEDSTNGIVTLDTTNHTVTLKAAQISMGTQTDLVKTALNIQLNQGSDYDCLRFTSGANTRTDLLSATLSLTDNLSFAGTGITGFMRDGSDSVGEFTGTLNGGSHTITLAIGEVYGLTDVGSSVSSSNEGVGQIYRHPYNGLFAAIGNGTTGTGTVNALTIAGSINVRNKIDGMNIGGIAAVSKGNTTLNGITANQTVNYSEPSSITGTEAKGKNIGGLIGLAEGSDNGTIAVTGTNTISTVFNISNNFKSWNSIGAFIGKVKSTKFTINIAQDSSDKLTVSHTMAGNFTAGGNADGGGLIGYITSGTYSNRKINIKNLDFNGCTIINRATSNGGGFLGYVWLDTDTTIAGLTVTNGTITNSSPNVGVMCYVATGRWTVDNLRINKMSLSGGAGTSLGMLVNKAYDGTNGLYLNVLKTGYTLIDKNGSTGITLPNSLGIYDELAAYSASDVIKGTYTEGNNVYGAGVISINMNSDRNGTKTKIRDYDSSTSTENGTGTYQNQLASASSALGSTKYANVNSRYYYNLDVMSSSDATQNIMLWSVKQYAASNFSGLFVSSNTPFSFESATDVKLSNYSYYPVYDVSSLTMQNINLDLGYSGIYDIEGSSTYNSDNYNRDPNEQNQHYLMQSGLFINGSEGSTLTLNTVRLSGDFLEDSTYQGVLFSGETKGSISIDGLVLDGIAPKYNNSGTISNYTSGYLLVKKFNRVDAFKENIQISLQNISTTDKYTSGNTTAQVTKSLFGDVYGPAIGINISNVMLDSRISSGAVSGDNKTALDSAYGTVNSIFSTATMFNSIKTSQAASMTYNYSLDDDWNSGRNVTYGREVSESIEYEDQENKYYNDENHFTDPTSSSNTTSPYDFGTNWRPYVGTAYSAGQTQDVNGCFYRELKVNVPAVTYSRGCGTYNDPYEIDSGAKLTAIAALINDASNATGLPTLQLPVTLYDGISDNVKGARWCSGKQDHALYTYDNIGNYTSTDPNITTVWSVDNVRLYLANSYYSIKPSTDDSYGNIILENGYLGLGGTASSGKYAFRGVIVGNSKTIINNSSNPLVRVSNGCVIKDLNVKQNVDVSVTAQTKTGSDNAYFGYNSACQYYGGMIGEIMGGDNIIDNSYVNFGTTTVTLTGAYNTIVPVGGYVGVIVYGGLIFKNIDARKTTLTATGLNVCCSGNSYNLADNSGDEALAAIYVNPLVGRVINGYAINETGGNAKDASGSPVTQFSNSEDGKYHDEAKTTRTGAIENTIKNGKKHYPITDIDPTLAKLDVTSVPANATTDGNINVPNAQALFILSLITQSCAGTATGTALGAYSGSLAYGTYDGNVYGMSHNADYSDVGTDTALVFDDSETDEDESNITDYQKLAYFDTANNSDGDAAVPYIIRRFTTGGTTTGVTTRTETRTRTVTKIITETITSYSAEKYTETSIPSGSKFLIRGTRNTAEYMTNECWVATTNYVNKRNSVLYSTYYYNSPEGNLTLDQTKIKNATEFYFEQNPSNNSQYCIYYLDSNDERNYLTVSAVTQIGNISLPDGTAKSAARGNLLFSSTPTYFTVEYNKNNKSKWSIKDSNNKYINYAGDFTNFCAWTTVDDGSYFDLYTKTVTTSEESHEVSYEEDYTVEIPIYATTHNYPARCVTSTNGFYNINLTGNSTYIMPDSFRGLGCVGMYDSGSGKANKYSIKLNVFDGKGKTIDLDVFFNKFNKDNYFDKLHGNIDQNINTPLVTINGNTNTDNHGIGLFDSVIMKNNESKFYDFDLTGSVRTAIYNCSYALRGECHEISADMLFLSVGGVCGWAKNNTTNIGFEGIDINNLTICGTNHFGGLLGYSGLQSPTKNNNNTVYYVWIKKCTADNISLRATAGSTIGDARQARCGMGAFVGKAQEGAVYIYGTEYGENNPNPNANYSEVRIKSFELTSGDTLNYNMSAGGLVGFAGNGCKIYDMHVSSKTSTVTIGGNLVNFAGGMVGGMQSSYDGGKSGVAVFKNCVVQNINVNGNYAGGIYGGKWDSNWTTYSITMDNCQMIGTPGTHNSIFANDSFGDNSNANPNHVGYAGGLIGKLYPFTNLDDNNQVTYNVLIKDCVVSNYDITAATTATSYAGGFIGYASSVNQSVTCYMHDSSVENCKIGANGNYAGGIVGRVIQKSNNQILGYNIKLDTITTDSGNKMGTWIGHVPSDTNDKKTSIQLVGMAIYGSGFARNIGNDANLGTASFVFADFDGKCNTVADNTTPDISSYNHITGANSNSVDMPKYPYVNIFPQSSMGTGEIISGDAAVLTNSASNTAAYSGKTAEKTMALKLYEDLYTSDSRRYTTFESYNDTAAAKINGDNKIDYYMTRPAGSDGDRISSYYTEKGYTSQGYADFACIVIANTTHAETTALINRYAQLVTNTTTDYIGTDASNDYFNIVLSTCKLEGGRFVVDTTKAENEHGLLKSNNQLCLNSSYADSMSSTDSITLVDIQFNDPLDTDKIAYHLYIPVYTIKQMTYDFATSTVTGTSPDVTVYGDLDNPAGVHADSIKTWITEYVRFTYKELDIQDLLDSGSLDWNVDKVISYVTQANSQKLPNGTHMVLVDPNGDSDKMYSATVSTSVFDQLTNTDGWKIDFGRFVDTSPTPVPFEPGKLSDILSRSITLISGDKYVQSDSTSYTLCYYNNGVKEYYTYVGTGGTCSFDANGDFNEDYFISFWVPDTGAANDLYYYRVTPEATLTGGKTIKLDGNHTQNIIIADLYEQDSEQFVVRPSEQQITAAANEITVRVASTISLPNNVAAVYLDTVDLYHSFDLLLNRYEENGSVSSNIYGLDPSRITARYGIETGTYDGDEVATFSARNIAIEGNDIVIETGEIMDTLLGVPGRTFTIYADITMEFDPDYLSYEFPNKTTEDALIGVIVSASSNLSYQDNTERLAHSSITESFGSDPENKFYYVNAVTSALLSYSAINELDYYDTDGRQSQNQSRLGLNGRSAEMTMMPIHTEANYNVDVISNWQSGDKIRLTLSLEKKTDEIEGGVVVGANYVEVDIADFLTITSVTSGNVTFTKNNELSNAHKLVYEANSAGCEMVSEGYYHFDIAFTAHTGEGFEDYANFKLNLQAELRDTLHGDARTVENSSARDYIVYTNAKIFNDVINQGQINQGNP